jgi:hypothetical protein
MRLLLLGHGRCGSTSLHLGLSEVLNLKEIIEPFNKHLWDDYYQTDPPYNEGDYIEDNTFFKCINGPHFNNEWILENYQNFDKVIMLIRGDIRETLISHCNALQYGYSNIYKPTNSITKESIDYVSENYNWLFNLYTSSENIHLLWYEDIYTDALKSSQAIDSLGLNLSREQMNLLYSKYLSPVHRLRKA